MHIQVHQLTNCVTRSLKYHFLCYKAEVFYANVELMSVQILFLNFCAPLKVCPKFCLKTLRTNIYFSGVSSKIYHFLFSNLLQILSYKFHFPTKFYIDILYLNIFVQVNLL